MQPFGITYRVGAVTCVTRLAIATVTVFLLTGCICNDDARQALLDQYRRKKEFTFTD